VQNVFIFEFGVRLPFLDNCEIQDLNMKMLKVT